MPGVAFAGSSQIGSSQILDFRLGGVDGPGILDDDAIVLAFARLVHDQEAKLLWRHALGAKRFHPPGDPRSDGPLEGRSTHGKPGERGAQVGEHEKAPGLGPAIVPDAKGGGVGGSGHPAFGVEVPGGQNARLCPGAIDEMVAEHPQEGLAIFRVNLVDARGWSV